MASFADEPTIVSDRIGHVFDHIDDPPVNRISLEVFAFNARAIAVYERVGFRREGLLREALRWDDAFHETIVMSILRRDRTDGHRALGEMRGIGTTGTRAEAMPTVGARSRPQ